MKTSLRIGRLFGIPIVISASWLVTISAVTALLALRVYPEWIPERSAYKDDHLWHWLMAGSSALLFFASIVIHELAHSLIALRQGIPVRSITLFIFGGVSQIEGEARRPGNEFVMAIAGPAMSVVLGLLFLLLWALVGFTSNAPVGPVLTWLFLMNIVLAMFNMAPGFPMDGGRVLRSLLWSITGSQLKATRLATLLSRGIGYALAAFGALVFLGLVGFFDDEFSGLWFVFIGLFLENSARQSWFQARAFELLSRHKAEDLMSTDLDTVEQDERLRDLVIRARPKFIFFVVDSFRTVVGVLTEREAASHKDGESPDATAGQLMTRTADVKVAGPEEDGAALFQTMESASIWHLPVVSEGRVLGVVSRERLLRMLASQMEVGPGLSSPR